MTNSAGGFILRDVQLGSWWIGIGAVKLPGEDVMAGVCSVAMALRVSNDAIQEPVTIRACRGVQLRGRVEFMNGSPAIDARVSATPVGGQRSFSTRVDSGGRFVLGPLGPGRYELFSASYQDVDWFGGPQEV